MSPLDDWVARWSSRSTGPGPQHLPEPPRALTAAGAKINLRRPDPAHTRHEQWQYASWSTRNTVPEMRFAGDFVASALGRLRVFPAENRPRGEEPVPLERATSQQQQRGETGVDEFTRDAAIAAVERLNLNQHGTSLLSRYAENLEYAGQGYLLGELDDNHQEQWSIRSILECQITTGGGRLVDPVSGMQQRELKADEVELFKLWSPDPAYYNQADAPVRGVLNVLREMDLLAQRGIAHAQSRISLGKGMYLPQELLMISGPAAVSADLPGVIEDASSDGMLAKLIEYMSIAVNNPDDPSSLAPLLLTGPATIDGQPTKDLIGTFDIHGEDPSGLDERYEALVMRFARGINLSPERIKGIGESTTNWSANAVTADEVKACVEPRGERMCDSLTAAYLHPTMLRMGVPPAQVAKVCLWFDASELTQNPNRGQDAQTLFNAGELSGDALRAANGFTEADKPSSTERLRRQLATERLAPESIPAMIALEQGRLPTVDEITAVPQVAARLAERANAARPVVDATPNRLPAAPRAASKPDPTPPVGQRTQPATATQPGALGASAGKPKPQWRLDRELGRRLARIDADFTSRVLAAADSTIGRAVEKAANRIRGAAQKDARRKSAFEPGSDPRVVLAAAGPAEGRRLAGDLTDAQLLDGAFAELEATFMAEADAAATAVEAVLEKRLPGPLVAAGGGRGVAAALRTNARRAWQWLADRLHRHAIEVLYGGRRPTRGDESSPGLTPVSLIRGAAALFGGLGEQHPGITDDGVPATTASGAATPASGPGSGEVALDRLRVSGALVLGHEWQHMPSKNQLPGHAALDGEFFADWNDPVLTVRASDAWLGRSHYAIGDHSGCSCLSAAAFAIPMQEGADPRGDEVKALRAVALSS